MSELRREWRHHQKRLTTSVRLIALLVPICAGVLLIAAATLKAVGGSAPEGTSHQSFVLQFGIIAEGLFGAWLVSGYRQPLATRMAVIIFLAFAIVSFHRAASGKDNCGCFGSVSIRPHTVAATDILVAISLYASLRIAQQGSVVRARVCPPHWLSGVRLAMVVLTPFLVSLTQSPNGGQRVVEIDPSWVGKPASDFETLRACSIPKEDSSILLFYRYDCTHCLSVLRGLERLIESGPTLRIRLLEVPPHGTSEEVERLISAYGGIAHQRLDSDRQWTVPVPLLFRLERGIVREAVTGDDVLDWCNRHQVAQLPSP